jgi:hypothetical protein
VGDDADEVPTLVEVGAEARAGRSGVPLVPPGGNEAGGKVEVGHLVETLLPRVVFDLGPHQFDAVECARVGGPLISLKLGEPAGHVGRAVGGNTADVQVLGEGDFSRLAETAVAVGIEARVEAGEVEVREKRQGVRVAADTRRVEPAGGDRVVVGANQDVAHPVARPEVGEVVVERLGAVPAGEATAGFNVLDGDHDGAQAPGRAPSGDRSERFLQIPRGDDDVLHGGSGQLGRQPQKDDREHKADRSHSHSASFRIVRQ